MAIRPLTLNLALVTWRPEGIARVAAQQLPRVKGVRYVVSWQNHGGAPVPDSLEQRDDMDIYRCEEKGISANRNNAISHCTGDIILMADDDITYDADSLIAVIVAFEKNHRLDMATFRFDGAGSKPYPAGETDLSFPLPYGFWVSSVEIAVLKQSPAGRLRFCPELGLGGRYPVAEDELFVLAALRRGIVPRFFPVVIGRHNGPTSGQLPVTSKGALEALGIYAGLAYGIGAPLRVYTRARLIQRQGRASFIRAFAGIMSGIFKAPAFRRRNKEYIW